MSEQDKTDRQAGDREKMAPSEARPQTAEGKAWCLRCNHDISLRNIGGYKWRGTCDCPEVA